MPDKARVITLTEPSIAENTYIVISGSKAAVIDPGADIETIKSEVSKAGAEIASVLLTHGHYDHIASAKRLDAKIYAHENERPLLENPAINMSAYAKSGPVALDKAVYLDGEEANADGFVFYHTPGHTSGSCVIKYGDLLFTGDTLFLDTVGRTDLPTGDPRAMKESLKVFGSFDCDIMCYPGHGSPFKLKDAYRVNYFLRAK